MLTNEVHVKEANALETPAPRKAKFMRTECTVKAEFEIVETHCICVLSELRSNSELILLVEVRRDGTISKACPRENTNFTKCLRSELSIRNKNGSFDFWMFTGPTLTLLLLPHCFPFSAHIKHHIPHRNKIISKESYRTVSPANISFLNNI